MPPILLPPGGLAGQVLMKASDNDYDVVWVTLSGYTTTLTGGDPTSTPTSIVDGGGTTGTVTSIVDGGTP
jgi:hypothetical protein